MHFLLNLEKFKIYIKIHIKVAPSCFGLRPSSGSLYWAWQNYIRTLGKIRRYILCGGGAACLHCDLHTNTHKHTRTHAHRITCCHNIDYVQADEHSTPISVVLAKHRIAPWGWFLYEPKHVGANNIFLTILQFWDFIWLSASVGTTKGSKQRHFNV
jgi:hypothetical protein